MRLSNAHTSTRSSSQHSIKRPLTSVPRKRMTLACSAASPSMPIQHPAIQLANLIVCSVCNVATKARDFVHNIVPKPEDVNVQEINKQIRDLGKNMRIMAVILPFAKAASSEALTQTYAQVFERAAFGFAKMYLFCLFLRVLLSWFPSIDWNTQPWTFLRLITEPYLQIYRGILPPLFGQLDFTPLIGFLILQDVVEFMAPNYTAQWHAVEESTKWTTTDVMCYFDGH